METKSQELARLKQQAWDENYNKMMKENKARTKERFGNKENNQPTLDKLNKLIHGNGRAKSNVVSFEEWGN